MKHAWQKVVVLSALGFVVTVDLAHWILNRIFDPFTSPLDSALHFVLPVAPILYLAVCAWGVHRLANWLNTTSSFPESRHASWILLILLAGQIAFTMFGPARSGSSRYHPLFPDFLGGILLAMATLFAGREHLRSRIGGAFVVLLVFFWLAGALTVDLLWWTERTNRGVGPVWRLPLLSSLLAAVSYIFIFGGGPVETCVYFPSILMNTGTAVQLMWLVAVTGLAACGLRLLTPNRVWLPSAALAASAVFFAYKAIEWSSFIAD